MIQTSPLIFISPMAGVTDYPFRKMVRKFSSGLLFSEMVASRPFIDGSRIDPHTFENYGDEYPLGVQIAGCDPLLMAEAARIIADRGAAHIDINFGCPVKKVVNGGSGGSALMRDIPLATEVLSRVAQASPIPVSVKMRLGWDSASINAPEIAKIAEQCGMSMITVHGRTRQQLYNGAADHHAVRAVKECVSIPVIVNGDITCADDARRALAQSGADGAMIGRAAQGRPWILQHIHNELAGISTVPVPHGTELRDLMFEHYDSLLSFYGTERGGRIARKHIGWYLADTPESEPVRAAINQISDPETVRSTLNQFLI